MRSIGSLSSVSLLEDLNIYVDIDPTFMLLTAVGSRLVFPPSLQTVALWGEEGTGNLGALHAILAASKVGKLSAEFVGLVQRSKNYSGFYGIVPICRPSVILLTPLPPTI
jgi:hypothetical protein